VLAERLAAARRAAPCVVFLPDAHAWFPPVAAPRSSSRSGGGNGNGQNGNGRSGPGDHGDEKEEDLGGGGSLLAQLGDTLLALLSDLPPALPLLLVATADVPSASLPIAARRALTSAAAGLLSPPFFSSSASSSSAALASSSSSSFASSASASSSATRIPTGAAPSLRAVERWGLCELAPPDAAARAAFVDGLLRGVSDAVGRAAARSFFAAAAKPQGAAQSAQATDPLPLAPVAATAAAAARGLGDAALRDEARQSLKREHTLRELRICLSR
jgi:SpoVK/Ycf46/Vps4 family AAA+-type ATPase